jgi:radical SAM superfamily enzyme YgiQ (UPF0313 family)
MRVLLLATYELGHQPSNLAVPAARLQHRGHEVRMIDLAIDHWDPRAVDWADKVAFSVPMHTAARLAHELASTIDKPVCCYGLYAAMCAHVADCVIAGEYEDALVDWVEDAAVGPLVELGRDVGRAAALRPARALLAPLERYARLVIGDELRLVGAVEASRGCVHRCRHCPVPVVYDGRVRIASESNVRNDIEQLVGLGARHITFADPDFLNAPHHSLRVVRAMHEDFDDLTFDCTTKVEHILRHTDVWPELAAAGCLFVVSAFESVNDGILERLDKGHTAADAARAVVLLRGHGIEIRPSFMPFTPWTTFTDMIELLDFVYEHDLVANVDPVQFTIRLLLPEGSLLLGHPDLGPYLGTFDEARLGYSWVAADPSVDVLHHDLSALVAGSIVAGDDATRTYRKIRAAVGARTVDLDHLSTDRPHLSESWFCCAEPTDLQLRAVRS